MGLSVERRAEAPRGASAVARVFIRTSVGGEVSQRRMRALCTAMVAPMADLLAGKIGRVTRLMMRPLLIELKKVIGDRAYFDYLGV